jgi:polysaccharide deacetylase
MNRCTIVMYHYVRDSAHCRYPELKALDTDRFVAQLDYLQASFHLISAEDIHACLVHDLPLPKNACLLTFDDGYLEHYTIVFPELVRRGLSACFYPPVAALARDRVLDVNKIHFLLAHNGYAATSRLVKTLRIYYEQILRQQNELPSFEQLWKEYAHPSRFDTAEVIFFKRALQHALPAEIRARLLDELFLQYMDVDEPTLAQELYVSPDMLRIMARQGMHIGIHGASHIWLDKADASMQKAELETSISMLEPIYESTDFLLSIAYPYGGYNTRLLEICGQRDVCFGLTIIPEQAEITRANRLCLPRLDANDIIC